MLQKPKALLLHYFDPLAFINLCKDCSPDWMILVGKSLKKWYNEGERIASPTQEYYDSVIYNIKRLIHSSKKGTMYE